MFIGTLSLNINTHDLNYGALLHSWAFQKFLEKNFECRTEIIDYTTPMYAGKNLKYPGIYLFKEGHFVSAIYNMIRMPSFIKRFEKFHNFICKEMKVSKIKYTQDALDKSSLEYDTIICESDVIWSTDFFRGALDKTFFCNLASMKNLKKIIYAASMANADFNNELIKEFQQNISDLKYISCRESYAVDITSKYTNVEVKHVLDPVLLLDSKDYFRIIGSRIIDEPYLLMYMPVGTNKYVVNSAYDYAKKHGLKIIEISNSLHNVFRHKVIRDAGIEEFLSLIYHAHTIFTDSFHAVCFSLLFHKDFYAFSRRTGKKIEDICHQFGLENRYFVNDFKEQENIDFGQIENKLAERKKYSIEYLENALMD